MCLAVFALVVVAFWIPAVVAGLKGRWIPLALGAFVVPLVPWIVAWCRLAAPDSWWARRYYDPGKLAAARARFERWGHRSAEPPPPPQPPPPP